MECEQHRPAREQRLEAAALSTLCRQLERWCPVTNLEGIGFPSHIELVNW
jgi:hypothetical protein